MRALIAEFKQESNTFNKRVEKSSARISFGREAESAMLFSHNELNGFADELRRFGVSDVCISVCLECPCGGFFSEDAFRFVMNAISSDIESVDPDIILVALNGATVLEGGGDGAGMLLEECRNRAKQGCVIGATVDMHANLTEKMARAAEVIVSYKTIPHTDLYEVGRRVAELCVRTAKGSISPYTAMLKIPMLIPPELGATDKLPVNAIMTKLAGLENRKDVFSASFTLSPPGMNIKGAGCAVLICAEGRVEARRYAKELGAYIWSLRYDMLLERKSIKEAIALARAPKVAPVLLVDAADSPAAGGYGDSAEVIRGLLECGQGLKAACCVVDAAAARLSCIKGAGNEIETPLGGWSGAEDIAPVEFKGRVASICSGLFCFKGAAMRGRMMNMGMAAVLERDGLKILVMENAVDNRDPEMYRAAGIEPEGMDIIAVKSAVGYTSAYEGLYGERAFLDSPGIARTVFEPERFDKLGWKVFPLHKDVDFDICDADIITNGKDEKTE